MIAPAKFRKLPVVVEAMQWTGDNINDIWDWAGADAVYGPTETNPNYLKIATLEGEMTAHPGYWIIRGVAGEIYLCKPDIFETTYEPVEATPEPATPSMVDQERG